MPVGAREIEYIVVLHAVGGVICLAFRGLSLGDAAIGIGPRRRLLAVCRGRHGCESRAPWCCRQEVRMSTCVCAQWLQKSCRGGSKLLPSSECFETWKKGEGASERGVKESKKTRSKANKQVKAELVAQGEAQKGVVAAQLVSIE